MKVNEDEHSARDPSLGDEADERRIRAYLEGDRAVAEEIDSWIRKAIAVRYPILRPEIDDLESAICGGAGNHDRRTSNPALICLSPSSRNGSCCIRWCRGRPRAVARCGG
jgi:hypothetical protein